MKSKTLALLSLTVAAFVALGSTSFADPITVTDGISGGSGDVDNVLYNPGETGLMINATINSNPGFNAIFTSTEEITSAGGQASLKATDGDLRDLTFSLSNGATFTKLILNPDAIAGPNGTITFTVNYIMPAGVFNSASFTLNANGQNFYTIEAGMGALITSVTFNTSIAVVDANQYRVGGLAPAQTVPEGGATLMLLGAALGTMAVLRRTLLKRSPAA